MSAHLLRFIPTDPSFVPDRADQDQALLQLTALFPLAESIQCHTTRDTEFIDCGGNFIADIQCSICHTSVEIDWWLQMIDNAYKTTHFQDLLVVMPCCGQNLSLNDLEYESPVGFARFVVEIRNPGEIKDSIVCNMVEAILKCRLKYIWAHY